MGPASVDCKLFQSLLDVFTIEWNFLTGLDVRRVISIERERGRDDGGMRSGAPVDSTEDPAIVHIHCSLTVNDC